MAKDNKTGRQQKQGRGHANCRSAKKKAKSASRKFANKIRKYAKSHSAPKEDMDKFADALGYGHLTNTMLASDLVLRRKSICVLGEELENLRRENPELEFHFWTLIHKRGNTSDREPVIDLKFLRRSVDQALRKFKLNGIYVIEAQGLGNYPGQGNGRTIMVHAHAITWSDEKFDRAAAAKALNVSEAWRNDGGPIPVLIKDVSNQDGELAYIAYYLLKPPYDVKMLENRSRGPRLKSTEKGLRPEFAARHLEFLSQIELKELVHACSGGTRIRSRWSERIRFWHKSRAKWVSGTLPPFYFKNHWGKYRSKKKKKVYLPFDIKR